MKKILLRGIISLVCMGTSSAMAGVDQADDTLPPNGPVQWKAEDGGNDHWYQYVDHRASWEVAFANTAALKHQGMQGYLLTITTLEEDRFIDDFLKNVNAVSFARAWMGLTDKFDEGEWVWSAGPEQGDKVWSQGAPIPGKFSNWGGNPDSEINNIPDQIDYSYYRPNGDSVDGRWSGDRNSTLRDYLVEYSPEVTTIPVPAAVWLFGSGLLGLFWVKRGGSSYTNY